MNWYVGVLYSDVCSSTKFLGTRMCFEKVGVALYRSNTCALHNSNPM